MSSDSERMPPSIMNKKCLHAMALGALILTSIALLSMSMQSASAALSVTKIEEKMDVRGRAIPLVLPAPYGSITAYHLFIVYTDKFGSQFECQGFPFDPATGQVAPDSILLLDPPGLLTQGECIPYVPGLRNYIPDAPTITVLTGKEAKHAYNCIVERNSTFNSAAIPYHAITGPNSNTYASTMLAQCGAPVLKPAVAIIVPGWIVP